jgi:hypothetical protein
MEAGELAARSLSFTTDRTGGFRIGPPWHWHRYFINNRYSARCSRWLTRRIGENYPSPAVPFGIRQIEISERK